MRNLTINLISSQLAFLAFTVPPGDFVSSDKPGNQVITTLVPVETRCDAIKNVIENRKCSYK